MKELDIPTRRLVARFETEAGVDIFTNVVAPVAGATFVGICLLVFFCCFRVRKSPKDTGMAKDSVPLPPAERPPWAV